LDFDSIPLESCLGVSMHKSLSHPPRRGGLRLALATALIATGLAITTGPVAAVADVCGITPDTSYEGAGISGNPYKIGNAAELAGMASLTSTSAAPGLGDHYQLIAEIDLADCANWPGIGSSDSPFSGVFNGDGDDFSISNLTMSVPVGGRGLFNEVNGAEIRNLRLSGVQITTDSDEYDMGALAGVAISSTISAVSVTGLLAVPLGGFPANGGWNVGGLIGIAVGTLIEDSHAEGQISGKNSLGGLVGKLVVDEDELAPARVTGSSADVTISAISEGYQSNAGGLVGVMSEGAEIADSHATGAVSGDDTSVGGLIGDARGVIERSFATGTVSGVNSVGGLVGRQAAGRVSESFFLGRVVGINNVGGLVGEFASRRVSTIEDSYSLGDVFTTDPENSGRDVGGLVGFVDEEGGTIAQSFSAGNVTTSGSSFDSFGGLIGTIDRDAVVTVTASFWDTETSGWATSAGGVGKTTAALTDIATFSEWSISDELSTTTVWNICPASGYPFLSWQAALPEGHPGVSACRFGAGPDTDSEETNPVGQDPTPTPVTPTPDAPAPSRPAPLPAPVPAPGGALPALTPGESQVLLDGVPVSVEVFVDNQSNIVMRGEGFDLRLAAQCTSECQIRTDASGRQVLTLEAASRAKVDGEGFAVGSTVYVWLFSTPVLLGELTVDAAGNFSGTVPLGDVAVGSHTLQINGVSADGAPRTANLGVEVIAQEAVLPATGAESTLMISWVILLASFGGLLMLLGRRPAVFSVR
jgi:hypothetical protein